MAYSRIIYTADGTTDTYAVPFHFLSSMHLNVWRNMELLVRGIDYVVDAAKSTVRLLSHTSAGSALTIARRTPRTTEGRMTVFSDGSSLPATDLNGPPLQLLFIIQEVLDDIAVGIGVGGGGDGGGESPGQSVSELQDLINRLSEQLAEERMAREGSLADLAEVLAGEHSARVAEALQLARDIAAERNARLAGLGELEAAINNIQTLVSSPDTVVAQAIQDIIARLGHAEAAITSEASARASEDSALSAKITQLQAIVGSSDASFTNRVKAAIADFIVEVSDLTALESRMDAAEAALVEERTTRATEVSAVSQETSDLRASVAGNAASLSTLNQAVSTADAALGQRIDTLKATVTDADTGLVAAHARINTETAARAEADEAIAGQIATLQSQVVDNVTGLPTVLAKIEEERTARTNADTALSHMVSDATAAANEAKATASSEASARATADEALGQRIDTVTAKANGLEASVTAEATARVNADNSLKSEYVMQVNAAGVITGIRLTSLGGGTAPRSEIAMECGKFTITDSTGSIVKVPFRLEDGTVYIDNGVIKNLGVDKLLGGSITSKEIILKGSDSVLRSDDYVPGVSGWKIDGQGNVEFNKLTVRTDNIQQDAMSEFTQSITSELSINCLFGYKIIIFYSFDVNYRQGYSLWRDGVRLGQDNLIDSTGTRFKTYYVDIPPVGWVTYKIMRNNGMTPVSSDDNPSITALIIKR